MNNNKLKLVGTFKEMYELHKFNCELAKVTMDAFGFEQIIRNSWDNEEMHNQPTLQAKIDYCYNNGYNRKGAL